jgi:hypothetical protein
VVYTSDILKHRFRRPAAESKAPICHFPKPSTRSRCITIGSISASPHNSRLLIIGLSLDLTTALIMHFIQCARCTTYLCRCASRTYELDLIQSYSTLLTYKSLAFNITSGKNTIQYTGPIRSLAARRSPAYCTLQLLDSSLLAGDI